MNHQLMQLGLTPASAARAAERGTLRQAGAIERRPLSHTTRLGEVSSESGLRSDEIVLPKLFFRV